MDEIQELKQRIERLEKELKGLKILQDVNQALAGIMQLDSLLGVIMDSTKKALDADRCTLFLLDRKKNELWSRLAHGMGSSEIRFPADKGLAGSVVTTGELINIPEAYEDPRFNKEVDKKTGYRTKSILTAPMHNRQQEIIGVFQVLNKADGPFEFEDEELLKAIAATAAISLETAQLYHELKEQFDSMVVTMGFTIDARDPQTAGHSERVTKYSVQIGLQAGMTPRQIEVLRYSALLHDFGKIHVRDDVLKKDGRLTDEEYAHIQSHAEYTAKILRHMLFSRQLERVPEIAAAHHEKFDGTGYPKKLKDGEIPEEARILAVSDVFDAITSKRHYRDRMDFAKVCSIMKSDAGKHFDPKYIDAFFRIPMDRIVQILENDFLDEVDMEDMLVLEPYTLDQLRNIISKDEAERTDEEKDITARFGRYYYKRLPENYVALE